MQEEMQKSNAEIQQMTRRIVRNAETQSVFIAEQRRLEEQKRIDEKERARAARKEIKDVRDRNSKLVMQVNQSSVEAVEQAKRNRKRQKNRQGRQSTRLKGKRTGQIWRYKEPGEKQNRNC